MKLKMALATLGLSLMATAAFAQGVPVTLVADPTTYTLGAAPGIVDITGIFTYTGATTGGDVFAVPQGFNLANGAGYSDPGPANGGFFPLIDLGLVPLQLGPSSGTGAFQSFSGPILSLAFDGTAGATTGTVTYDIFNGDPFAGGTDIGDVTASFTIGAVVPEPGTVALLVGGLVGGSVMLRRRRK
jgi:hypothetical protein